MSEAMDSPFHRYLRERGGTPTLADAAIGLGVPVFPCDANKRPLTPHGFKDATTDPATIRKLFAHPRAVMIGAPTGEAWGVIAIDVDVKDGAQGGAWLDANSHRMPQTRTIRTGSGGLHLYFRWPDQPVKNSASKIAPGIDVRGDGGYVIVPPSPGYVIADDAPVAEVPDWLLPAILPPAAPEPVVVPRHVEHRADGYRHAALESACWEIANAPDGAKHDTLNREAYSIGGLVLIGELDHAEALAALRDALRSLLPRCKDQRAAEKTLHRAFREGMAKPRDVPEPEFQMPPPVEGPHPAAAFLAKIQQRMPEAPKAQPVSATIMQPGGVLQALVEECVRTAIRPQPFLALGAAICAVGVLAGRRYRTATDLRTNLYIAGIAESGGGKDHAPEVIRRCFDKAKLDRYLAGETVASGRAILSSLEQHPARLFNIDEFGLFLKTVTGPKAASHRAEIWSELMKLYSRAKGVYRGTEYANKKDAPRIDINQPCVCFYGTTTPSTFWSALEGGAMMDGSLARFLVFMSEDDRPDRNRNATFIDPPSSLTDALKAIVWGAGGPPRVEGGNLPEPFAAPMTAADEPDIHTVTMTADAKAIHEAKLAEEDAWARKVAGTPQAAIVNRLGENAAKLALVCAISRSPSAPSIGAHEITWGWAVAEHCTKSLLMEGQRFIADTEYERKANKLIEIIRRHGPVTDFQIYDRHRFRYAPKERAELLSDLTRLGVIQLLPPDPSKPGPKSARYIIAAGNHETE